MPGGEIDVDSGRARSEVQVVRAMFEAFARRDIEGALERVDPRLHFTAQTTATLAGRRGAYVGHEGLRQYFGDVAEHWEDLTLLPGDYRAVAGAVVVFGRVRGRRQGVNLETATIWTWRVSNRLVISGSVFATPEATGSGAVEQLEPGTDPAEA